MNAESRSDGLWKSMVRLVGVGLVVPVLTLGTCLLLLVDDRWMPTVLWRFQDGCCGIAAWPLAVWWLVAVGVPLLTVWVLRRWLLAGRGAKIPLMLGVVFSTGVMVTLTTNYNESYRYTGGVLWARTLNAEAYLQNALEEDMRHAQAENAEVLCSVLLRDEKQSNRPYFFAPERGLLFTPSPTWEDVMMVLDIPGRLVRQEPSQVPLSCRTEVEARWQQGTL